jgi:four helix bundle protein
MESFTKLDVWKKGMELVKEIYELTQLFPKDERFGLTSQIRRSVISILANLAEGFSRRSIADKSHKYTIARGECSETYAFILICIELEIVSRQRAQHAITLVQDVGSMLSGLINFYTKKCSQFDSRTRTRIPNP